MYLFRTFPYQPLAIPITIQNEVKIYFTKLFRIINLGGGFGLLVRSNTTYKTEKIIIFVMWFRNAEYFFFLQFVFGIHFLRYFLVEICEFKISTWFLLTLKFSTSMWLLSILLKAFYWYWNIFNVAKFIHLCELNWNVFPDKNGLRWEMLPIHKQKIQIWCILACLR